MSPTLNSFNLQFAAAASILSCISVVIIFIRIAVRPAFVHVFILLDEMLQWNIRWYKKTFPNGNWRLFKRPADIYMVCPTVFMLPFAPLMEFSP